MTDRIDHVAEAYEWLSNTADEYTREPHVHTNVVGYLAQAQVYATLALAREQRTANLIALWVGDSALLADDVTFERVGDEIKKGLGL